MAPELPARRRHLPPVQFSARLCYLARATEGVTFSHIRKSLRSSGDIMRSVSFLEAFVLLSSGISSKAEA